MIKVKGRITIFTGKDLATMESTSKALGLTVQDYFTGLLWEQIMRNAREGVFNAKKKGETKKAIRDVPLLANFYARTGRTRKTKTFGTPRLKMRDL